jgi:hypothetical protein
MTDATRIRFEHLRANPVHDTDRLARPLRVIAARKAARKAAR